MTPSGPNRFITIILAFLAGIFVVLFALLFHEYARVRSLRLATAHHSFIPVGVRGSLSANDVGMIQDWMTFDYINVAFNLPEGYLQSNLHIADTRYPRIALEEYAEQKRLSAAAFVSQVQNAVKTYLTATK